MLPPLFSSSFNSMKVRLKHAMVTVVGIKLTCFNSMKVRLKRDGDGGGHKTDVFQFHEGPIKTSPRVPCSSFSSRFQFHEGPIKTELKLNAAGRSNCFNSMKVRLKPLQDITADSRALFQFHEGPIKTSSCQPRCICSPVFQFHEGPIKTLPSVPPRPLPTFVSIP